MITTLHLHAARNFGKAMMFAVNGCPRTKAAAVEGFVEALDSSADKRVFEQQAVKVACEVMRQGGHTDKLAYHVASVIADYDGSRWPDVFSEFADISMRAIGRECLRQKQAAESDMDMSEAEVKEASLRFLGSLAGRGLALTPDLIKILFGVSALGGAAVGSAAWKINRDTKQDDDDLETMKAKIDTYDRISNDIEDELRSRMAARRTEVMV